ncbi:MAG: LamG domain-containing protein, partial [Verrucomicrobia bacterium]|nr:LamG domain-containing protein [Verrucomicrobiota bacterium]
LSNVVANSGCGSGSVYLPGTAASYVAVTNVSDLNFNTGSAFTLCAWINTSTPGVIAAKSTPGGSSANHTLAFYVDTSGVLRYDVFYVSTVTSSATVNSGQWTHVAVTCDGTTYRLYINGAPDGAKAFGGANDPGTWDFTVGLTRNGTFPQPNGAANGPFAGDIDEVAVWNSALSPNQLAYVYQNGVSLPIPAALAATAATGITTTSATLNGTLACTGTNAAVLALWNRVNGGTNAALWTNSAYVGSWTNVASTNLSLQVSGLIPQTQYYFTFRATNSAYNVWATNVQSFATLAPPPPPVLAGSAITMSNGVPNFTFGTTAGYKYRLVYKDTLTNTSWLPVIAPTNFPLPDGWSASSTGAPMSLNDTNTAGQSQRFYRLEAANP